MSDRKIKKREPIGSTLKADLFDELRKLSEETGFPISRLLDRAVELLIQDFKEKGMY